MRGAPSAACKGIFMHIKYDITNYYMTRAVVRPGYLSRSAWRLCGAPCWEGGRVSTSTSVLTIDTYISYILRMAMCVYTATYIPIARAARLPSTSRTGRRVLYTCWRQLNQSVVPRCTLRHVARLYSQRFSKARPEHHASALLTAGCSRRALLLEPARGPGLLWRRKLLCKLQLTVNSHKDD